MTTFDELVDRTINRLEQAAGRDRINFTDGSLTSTTEAITLLDTISADVQAGAQVECDYERMYVRSVTGQALTVRRAFKGTTAATHDDKAIIRIEPRWPRQDVLDALTTAIQSTPRQLFGVTTVDLAPSARNHVFDLTGSSGKDVIRVLEMWRQDTNGTQYPWRDVRCQVLRNMSTTDFTSGTAVQVDPTYGYDFAPTLRCTYAWGLDTATIYSTTDLESDLGLPGQVGEGIAMMAGGHLLMGREAERNDIRAQAESRFTEETPATAFTQIAEKWMALGNRLIDSAIEQLLDKYPYRTSDL